MFEDKITIEFNKSIKKIEKEGGTFSEKVEKIKKRLLEIYKPINFSYDDFISRKNYLQNSQQNFLSIYLTVILAVFSTFLFNSINKVFSFEIWNNITIFVLNDIVTLNYIFNQFVSLTLSVVFAIICCPILSQKSNKISQKRNRYNTIEFEIAMIDKILATEFNFLKIEQEILNEYLGHSVSKDIQENMNTESEATIIKTDLPMIWSESKGFANETKI